MSMTTPPLPRPNYTLTDAAALVGVSRSTIRRRREQGKFPNAFKTHDGEWMIPLTDLLTNGLKPESSEHVFEREQAEQDSSASGPVTLTPLAQAAQAQAHTELAHLREQLQLKDAALQVEQAKNEGLAQTLAATKQRADDLSLALRMIEQAKPKEEVKEPIAMGPAAPTARDLWKQGRTLKEIAAELGITEKEAWEATRTLPKEEPHWSEQPEGGYTVSPAIPPRKKWWQF